jgi:ATP-binding cassette, subfamily F, member 3
MNLLQLNGGYKHYGTKTLFQDASFALNHGEHVGVIGPNGAGKTTLFKILVEQVELDSGDLIKSNNLKIGYLEQEAQEPENVSCEDYLQSNCSKPLWELRQLGLDLGLQPAHFTQTFQALSGGYRMRMKLLSLIGKEPQLMLLDEPTNFLDLESILALEKFLQSYEGAFLLISHDREFLKRTTDHTLEVEAMQITKFPGTIDDYFEQKAQLRSILEAQASNQENKRKELQNFIDRFGAKATKARQAQSRMKTLEKMEKIDLKPLPVKAKIKIPSPIHTGKETLQFKNADLGYGDKKIISNCDIRLERGTHLGVVGFNGAGKSTLLKSLAGRIPLLSGERTLGYQVSLSYYAQHVSEDLDLNDNVLESLQKTARSDLTTQDILNIAGSLLFTGDDLYKKVRVLSGGEKSRVALGQILLQRSPLLLMDEPTNHLDFDTVQSLTEALKNYPGTVVVVSHDRSFIGSIATQILEIRDGHANIYPGTYDDYLWSLEKGALKDHATANTKSKETPKTTEVAVKHVDKPVEKINYRDRTKHLQSQIKEFQRKISKNEEKLKVKTDSVLDLNEKMIASRGTDAVELAKQLSELGHDVSRIEDELLQQMETLSQLETELKILKQ